MLPKLYLVCLNIYIGFSIEYYNMKFDTTSLSIPLRIMDEEIFGEGWKHLSRSKILPKRKTTYRH